MKIRNGFVSNSSSSSFSVLRSYLTDEQANKLLNYPGEHGDIYTDCWNLHPSDDYTKIEGWTHMDNGDLERYITEVCGIINPIKWDSEGW